MIAMTDAETRLWQRTQRYMQSGQIDAAQIALESFIQRAPQHTMARVMLAGSILSQGRVRPATSHLLAAASALPDDAGATCSLALGLLRVGEVVAARTCTAHAESISSASPEDVAALARVYQNIGEHEKALAAIERARQLGHVNPDFSYFRAIQLMFNGQIEQAEAELAECLRMQHGFGRATLTRARLRKQSRERNNLADLHERLYAVERASVNHAAIEFALFKEQDDLGDTDSAWSALERGNAIMHARLPHDVDAERALFDRLIDLSTPDFLSAASDREISGPQPIFIVGLPRSGTTLLERMLGNHSAVACAGELVDFPHQLRWEADVYARTALDTELLQRAGGLDYADIGERYLAQTRWRAADKDYFVDKLPPNYMLAGFIHRALPRAPILHMVRSPVDVCFSNYKALFGENVPYSYDFNSMAAHHGQYRRLMQHWHEVMPQRILDVSYARLVAEPQAVMREVLAYCGLDYESGCIDLARNSSPVATLSTAQVREPIHTRSMNEWRRYEAQLEPLRTLLSGR